ncbi:MAG: trypsin-like peptidase domain-containing protein [Planctomycetia bacterium]|nr:trypsin-like peptidase domain-containing protein [Planctomycetia bacterium]
MSMVAWCLLSLTLGAAEPEAIVLEFTAPSRCPPCQQVAPVVSRLQREGFPIRAIDVDTNPRAADPYHLQAVPTFVLLIAGREADRFEGKPSEAELRRMCERARMANVSTERADQTHEEPADVTSKNIPPKTESARSQPQPNKQPPAPPAKALVKDKENEAPKENAAPSRPAASASNLPIIRARHDDNPNLPPANSTNPLHLCVRIRVKDSLGMNFGSGTIIDSREGRTIILTCGHIFRKLDDRSVIDVDVFTGTKHETFVARLIKHNLEADVGLIAIPTARPLPAAIVSGLATAATENQHVFSVGCSGGDSPTKRQHRVTSLNRYLGPDNIECTDVPVQGRSGGGLFDTDSRLVGVCIAADQRDQRGLYAGLKPIHELLNQSQLAHLHPQAQPRPEANLPVEDSPSAAVAQAASTQQSPRPEVSEEVPFSENETPESPFSIAKNSASPTTADTLKLSAADRALLSADDVGQPPLTTSAELQSALEQSGESEVVCIIRPLKNPRATSRVVIINRASTKFLSQLNGELDQQAKPTSAVVRQAKYPTEIRPYRRAK